MGLSTEINNQTLNLYAYFLNLDTCNVVIYNNLTEIDFNLSNTTNILINMNQGLHILNQIQNMKVNYILLLIMSLNDLRIIFYMIFKQTNWNFNHIKFIIKLEDDTDINKVLKLSWDYYIVNIIALHLKGVYTYWPYEGTKCGNNITAHFLSDVDNLETIDYFPDKIPKNLKGCNIKLAAVLIEPFVMNISKFRENPTEVGIEVTMIHIIAKVLNFTEVYIEKDYMEWAHHSSHEIFNPIYKMIEAKQLDIAFGYAYNLFYKRHYIASTIVHMIDVNLFWVPAGLKVPMWKNLIKIFRTTLWISTIIAFIINGFAFWIIARIKQYYPFEKLPKSLFISWGILLNITTKIPKCYILRIPFIIWCISSLILNTCYTSKLIAYITDPLYEHHIKNVKQLIASDLKLGFDSSTEDAFNWNNKDDRKLLIKKVSCENFQFCLNEMLKWRNLSIFNNKQTMKYLIPRYYRTDGHELISKVKNYKVVDFLR